MKEQEKFKLNGKGQHKMSFKLLLLLLLLIFIIAFNYLNFDMKVYVWFKTLSKEGMWSLQQTKAWMHIILFINFDIQNKSINF